VPAKAIGILVILLVQLGLVGSASATGAGNQRFSLAGRIEDPSIVIAGSGPITGVGSLAAESVEFHPADKTYLETDIAVIGDGTLTMAIDGRFDVWPFTLDPRTCTQHGTLSGTWTITSAGGAFTGTTGAGEFRGHFFTYARRGAAGCEEATVKGFVAGSMLGSLSR
jgi:hypothetical protein